MRYFVLEESGDAMDRLYLGPICLNHKERKAMVRGEPTFIPDEPLRVPIRYWAGERLPDYLDGKFCIVSEFMKDILDKFAKGKIHYRGITVYDDQNEYSYYIIFPPRFDCLDLKRSIFLKSSLYPEEIHVTAGFYIRRDLTEEVDLLRVQGLSNRLLVLSERLKQVLEANGVQDIRYTQTDIYKNFKIDIAPKSRIGKEML